MVPQLSPGYFLQRILGWAKLKSLRGGVDGWTRVLRKKSLASRRVMLQRMASRSR